MVTPVDVYDYEYFDNTNDLVDYNEEIEITDPIYNSKIPPHCNQGNYIINNPAELNAIINCQTVNGNVTIINYKNPIVSLGNIEVINGNLLVTKSPDIVRIEGDSLTAIKKRMILRELTSLSIIVFPNLTSINFIEWRVLPILSSVHFNNEIVDLESITISDTSLTGFTGFLSNKLETFDINNNRFLDSIHSNVETIDESLHISANAYGTIVSLPNLKIANNMSISDVGDLDMGSLESVTHSVSLINNQFESLKFPHLKSIGGTLNIFKNKRLSAVNFSNVSEIGGGLIISNNTKIDKINFLPKLNIIGGAMELVGNIKELSMKQLKLVKGSTKVKTESPNFDCSQFLRSDIITVIRGGKIECSNANNEKFITHTPGSNESNPGVIYDGDGHFVQYPGVENNALESGTARFIISWLLPLGIAILLIVSIYQ